MATAPSFSGGAWAAARTISGRRAHQTLSRKFSVAFVGIKASPRMLFNAKDSNGRNDVQGKRKSLDLQSGPSPGYLPLAFFCQLTTCRHDDSTSVANVFSKLWFCALNTAVSLLGNRVQVTSELQGCAALGSAKPVPTERDNLAGSLLTGQTVITACISAGILGTAVSDLSENLVFMSSFWSWLIAQTMKYFTAFYREGRWDWRVMFDSGGMPSSHTSLVVGLTTAIGYQYGLGSTLFPLSLAFSLIVMYDAAGVRRHAGKQAEVLNRILDDMFHGESISQKKLKEVLGHSPLQVLAGAVLGVFIAILYAYKFGSGYASLSH